VADVATLVPAGGLASAMVVLVSYMLRQYGLDRQRDARTLAAEQERTKAAEARTAEARSALKAAHEQVDLERRLRREAEAAASLAEARTEVLQMRLQWLLESMPPASRPTFPPLGPNGGGS
jgi:hypothetical protein